MSGPGALDAAMNWLQPGAGSVLPAVGELPPLGGTGLMASSRRAWRAGWSWLSAHKKQVAGGVVLATAVTGYVIYRKVQPMMSDNNITFYERAELCILESHGLTA